MIKRALLIIALLPGIACAEQRNLNYTTKTDWKTEGPKVQNNFIELYTNKEPSVYVGETAPADTTRLFLDSNEEAGILVQKKYVTGTGWVRVGSHGVQYASSCASITAGMCVDTDDGKLYYHNNTTVVEVGIGSGSSLPSWFPTTGPTDGRQILQAIGGCSNAAYSTQVTCEAASATWTTPSYTHTSVISGLINDTGTNDDDLWSAAKIVSELSKKQDDLVVPSQAEAEAGTSTTERVWTAQRVAQAIAALAPSSVGGNVILQQSFVSTSTLVADIGAKNKLASGVNWTTADVGCDASDTFTVSVKSSGTINGAYTEIGTIALSETASLSDVDISSWVDSIQGHWIRIDLVGTPISAKDCIIAIGGVEL